MPGNANLMVVMCESLNKLHIFKKYERMLSKILLQYNLPYMVTKKDKTKVLTTNGSLMNVERVRMLYWSILQNV